LIELKVPEAMSNQSAKLFIAACPKNLSGTLSGILEIWSFGTDVVSRSRSSAKLTIGRLSRKTAVRRQIFVFCGISTTLVACTSPRAPILRE
jgi:hypothetical protein